MVNAFTTMGLIPSAPAPFSREKPIRENETGSQFTGLTSGGKVMTWNDYKNMKQEETPKVTVKVGDQNYQGKMFLVDKRQYPNDPRFATVKVTNSDDRTFQEIDIMPGGKVGNITQVPGVSR